MDFHNLRPARSRRNRALSQRKWGTGLRAISLFFAGVLVSTAAAAEPATVKLPIHQTQMPNGFIRYSIPIRIGTTEVEAMLDTGSTGLYILPGVLAAADATVSDDTFRQSYGSGVELEGVTAKAALTLGGLVSPQPVQMGLVRAIDCIDRKQHCPASRIALADYRVGGGASGQGYEAIFGINFRDSDVTNPLFALDVESWIVELPKPGDGAPGILILNPSAAERSGYRLFHVDRRLGRLPGCLVMGDDKICGGVVLDTGAPGVEVVARERPAFFPWPEGAHVMLALKPDDGDPIGVGFDIHRAPGSPSSLYAVSLRVPAPFIRSGTLPYFAYSVLYDADSDTLGLKSR